MRHGFAAHVIILNNEVHKQSMVMVDDNFNFLEIRKLDRETPFTRFYDGTLIVTPVGCNIGVDFADNKDNMANVPIVDTATKVNIMQINPFDLFNMHSIPKSRVFCLK